MLALSFALLWKPSLRRHYPASSLIRLPSQDRGSFASLRFTVASAYSPRFDPLREPSDPPGSSPSAMCCSMPSATPGKRGDTRLWRVRSCCLLPRLRRRPFRPWTLSGLPTGFSFYRFTSQPCLHSLLRLRVARLRPFPVGFAPTHQRDHFQVSNHPSPRLSKERDHFVYGAALPLLVPRRGVRSMDTPGVQQITYG